MSLKERTLVTHGWSILGRQNSSAGPPPTTTTFRFVSAARTNIAGAKAAVAAAARKFRRFIITSSLSLAAVELPERDANRCILVRGCKPVVVRLSDAEELPHLLWSCRC